MDISQSDGTFSYLKVYRLVHFCKNLNVKSVRISTLLHRRNPRTVVRALSRLVGTNRSFLGYYTRLVTTNYLFLTKFNTRLLYVVDIMQLNNKVYRLVHYYRNIFYICGMKRVINGI